MNLSKAQVMDVLVAAPHLAPEESKVVLAQVTEKQFSQAVKGRAEEYGWRVARTWNSMRSTAGWPDLFMVRGSYAIAAELKREKGKGKTTPEQDEWLHALEQVPGVRAHVWRPSMWRAIEEALR